jgi:hypothetical protein
MMSDCGSASIVDLAIYMGRLGKRLLRVVLAMGYG